MIPTRRTVLLTAGAAALAAGIPHLAFAQDPAAAGLPFKLEALGKGVYAAIDIDGRSGANAGFVIGDNAVLVIDSFYNADAAKVLLQEIRKLTPLPVRYLVNTHYHIDHVSGNGVFANAGAEIIAQRNVQVWIHTENPKFYGDKITLEQRAAIIAIPGPDVLVDSRKTVRLGKRVIEIVARPGHTGGDVTVWIPDVGVMFCGDLFWRRIPPNLIDATVSKWIPTLEKIERARDADRMTYVPGHGDVGTLTDLAEFRGYLTVMRDTVAAEMKEGARGDNLIRVATPKLAAKYGAWPRFDRAAPREIGFMEAEIAGTKRVPRPDR
jgi:cyclase